MIWNVVVLILALAGLGWLGWVSVQSLRQASLLRSLPKGSVGALEGSTLAAHGTVKILEALEVRAVGPCLWCRTTVQELDSIAWSLVGRRRRWRTVNEETKIARFALVVGGQEIEIAAPPTEVQGSLRRSDSDTPDLIGQLFEGSSRETYEWLPVLEEMTVIGRLERRGDSRAVVTDPALGLLLSPHPPDRAARIEAWKGLGGVLAVIAGALLLACWWLPRIASKL